MHRRKTTVFAAIAATTALVAAGCGDSGDGGSSSSEGSAPSGKPIKLGQIMTPAYIDFAPAGAEAAISAINATGGINGRPLELEVCDNQNDANAAAACARKFANDPSVIATVGDNSAFGAATNPPLAKEKVAGVGTATQGAGDFASPRVFPNNSAGLQFLGSGSFLKSVLNVSNIGMAITGTPTSEALPDLLNKEVLNPLGAKISTVARIPATTTDVSSQAASLSKTEGQIVAITQALAERYIVASRQQGFKGPFLVSETIVDDAQLSKNIPTADRNDIYGVAYYDKNSEGYKNFLRDMKKYQPKVAPGDLNAITWLAVQMFAKVAEAESSITRDSIWDAMNKQSSLSTDGMTPPLDFTKPGTALDGEAPRVFDGIQTIYIDRLEDGKWVPYSTPQTPVPLFAK